MVEPQAQHNTWSVLKNSRYRITERYAGSASDGQLGLVDLAMQKARRERSDLTGFIPHRALASLVEHGMSQQDAEQHVRDAVLRRFPAFANSWDNYIEQRGFALELLLLTEEERKLLTGQPTLSEMGDALRQVINAPQAALADMDLAQQLASITVLAGRRDENHPAYALMVHQHGLDPELAKAVMLHNKSVPWWAFVAVIFFILITAGVFVLALIDPQSSVFQNESVGGVGILHYTVLPFFSILFTFFLVVMIRNRPKVEREWREQLEKYRKATGDS